MKTPQEINSFFEVSELFTATYYSDKDIIIHQGGTSCFDGNTLVVTKRGNVPIKDIQIGDFVLSCNEKTYENEWKEVKDKFKYENHKPTVRVKLKNGSEIICTDDHKFFYNGEWNELKNILSLLNEKD